MASTFDAVDWRRTAAEIHPDDIDEQLEFLSLALAYSGSANDALAQECNRLGERVNEYAHRAMMGVHDGPSPTSQIPDSRGPDLAVGEGAVERNTLPHMLRSDDDETGDSFPYFSRWQCPSCGRIGNGGWPHIRGYTCSCGTKMVKDDGYCGIDDRPDDPLYVPPPTLTPDGTATLWAYSCCMMHGEPHRFWVDAGNDLEAVNGKCPECGDDVIRVPNRDLEHVGRRVVAGVPDDDDQVERGRTLQGEPIDEERPDPALVSNLEQVVRRAGELAASEQALQPDRIEIGQERADKLFEDLRWSMAFGPAQRMVCCDDCGKLYMKPWDSRLWRPSAHTVCRHCGSAEFSIAHPVARDQDPEDGPRKTSILSTPWGLFRICERCDIGSEKQEWRGDVCPECGHHNTERKRFRDPEVQDLASELGRKIRRSAGKELREERRRMADSWKKRQRRRRATVGFSETPVRVDLFAGDQAVAASATAADLDLAMKLAVEDLAESAPQATVTMLRIAFDGKLHLQVVSPTGLQLWAPVMDFTDSDDGSEVIDAEDEEF